jgi:hypothetical protein
VSALYEQGRVHHVGPFQQLADQMCSFTADFDPKTMGYNPDRLDALVWAELMVEGEPESRPLFTSVKMGSGRARTPHCTGGHEPRRPKKPRRGRFWRPCYETTGSAIDAERAPSPGAAVRFRRKREDIQTFLRALSFLNLLARMVDFLRYGVQNG